MKNAMNHNGIGTMMIANHDGLGHTGTRYVV